MPFKEYYRHIFNILGWIMCLFLLIILYYYITRSVDWSVSALGKIEKIYAISRIIIIAGLLSSIINTLFSQVRRTRAIETKLIRRFFPIFRFFINLIIWVIGFFFMLESLDINTKNILAGAGIGGAIVALASKDLLTNLLGSLSILFSKNFEIGDIIRIRTSRLWIEGPVEEITLNNTKITNNTGEVVFVPNKTIYAESVENLSRRRFYTYEYNIPFGKIADPKEVEMNMKIIEGKISTYYPIEIKYFTENPNAGDYLYRIQVKFPQENLTFDKQMRSFLMPYIFRGSSPNVLGPTK